MAHPIVSRRSLAFSIALAITFLVTLATAAPILAGGTVTACSNDTGLNTALSGGGLVQFNCGTSTIPISSTKIIAANTTIDGGGKITLNAFGGQRIFGVNNGVTLTLKNIILENGYGSSSNGGTIYNAGHLILDNMTIRGAGNSNYFGGGVATIGPVDITNTTFFDNEAGSGGALFAIGGAAVVNISGSTFTENKVSSSNPDSRRGGAIYIANGATLNMSTSTVHKNNGAYGAGIANANSTLNLTDVTLSENEWPTTGRGGGIHNTGIATLTRVTVFDNFLRNGSGGGMFNEGTANLTNVLFERNGTDYGGGIANDHGDLTVTNAQFTGNYANVAGGGGIASSYGNLTVTNATFSNNSASGDAGGVENGRGTATLKNVTFYKNSASSGGGMWNLYGGTAELINVTFFKNRGFSDSAGGIGNTNDPNTHLYLKNVIVANSTEGTNCKFDKAPDQSSSNLSSDGTCNFGTGRDNVKIKLGPLGTNGGPLVGHAQTQILTLRLPKGSLPIDLGTFVFAAGPDERGVTRPRGNESDVGAIEYVPCTGAPTKPELVAPKNKGTVTVPQVLLDWAGPDCAKKFRVVVRQKNAGGPVVFTKSGLKPTQVVTAALTAGKKYVWQVTACDGPVCTVGDWFKFKLER